MLRKTYILGALGILLLVCLGFAIGLIISYGRMPGASPTRAAASLLPRGNDKETDGLTGPVNRVMTESAKLSFKGGKLVEAPRELSELATYDRQGQKVSNSYYLISTNAQAGKEEYAYDEKGNISEMTVRDEGNNVLSKEVYTYEYDAIGNWTKRVTYAVVYEGGKVRQEPTEATYRNITYYYDQTVANIAKPNPKDALGSGERAEGDLEALRSVLDAWVAATNARDAEKLISFYNSKVDAFYHSENVSQDFVRADKTRWFKRADLLEVNVNNPEITISGDRRTATMRFHKTYTVRVSGREHHGEVLEWLKWLRTDDGWKIVGERDTRVLRKD